MNDLELIKSKIDIVTYLSDYIQLKKAGRNFKALCPFHSEKTPSFVVSPDRQTWHCFGACNMGGDVFEFLVKWENVEFVEALKILAQKAGVTLSSYKPTQGLKIKERLYEVNHLASEYYHYILTTHPLGKKAYQYIKERGLNDKIIKTFALGYSPNSWDGVIKFLKKKNYTLDEIVSSGLAIKTDRGTIYDRFRGRLMFTLKDHRGNPIGFSGRKIEKDADKEAKYINTPETPVYIKGNALYGLDKTYDSIRREKEAVVVEGEFDFLSSFQKGVTNVVAIKGSAFTEGQITLLKRYTENLLLALDSDFAGSEAAKKGIEAAEQAGLNLHVVTLPFGKDPDECIAKDPSLWKKAIKSAVNIYDFLIDKAFIDHDKEKVSDKKKIGDEVIPFISRISNPIVFSHYIKLLAKKLDVSEESIELLSERTKSFKRRPETEILDKVPHKREELLEEHLLYLFLHAEKPQETIQKIFGTLELTDFSMPPIAQIFDHLTLYFKKNTSLDVKLFSKLLTPEIATTFDKAYLKDIDTPLKEKEMYQKELKKTITALKQISLRRRINILTTKMRKSEGASDQDKLQQEVKNLLEKMHDLEKTVL